MNLQRVLDAVTRDVEPHRGEGAVATYIPALSRVDAQQFGIAAVSVDGQEAQAGDARTPFSIQSISKVFTLTMAMRAMGEGLWERIGREPSGDPFNSLVQLEHEHGVPRNPFINAGAIAIADRVAAQSSDPKASVLDFVSDLCDAPVAFDLEVARSEADTGLRNRALANFIKSFGKLDHDVEAVLDLYFHQCSLAMSCLQVARALGYLCRDGAHPRGRAPVVTAQQARRINALMLTCGTYDAAGEFAFRVGLPCKSGVGGGIVAIVPDHMTLCVWSPGLDSTGNSAVGLRALERFTDYTGLSIF